MSSAQVVAWRNRLSDDLWFYSHGSMDPREVHDNGKEHEPLIKLTDHDAALAELVAESQLLGSQVEGLTTEIQILSARLQRTSYALTASIGQRDTLLTGLEALAGEMHEEMETFKGGCEGSWYRWRYDTFEVMEHRIRTLTNSAKGNDHG